MNKDKKVQEVPQLSKGENVVILGFEQEHKFIPTHERITVKLGVVKLPIRKDL